MSVSDCSVVPRKVWPSQWEVQRNPTILTICACINTPVMFSHWLGAVYNKLGLNANVVMDLEGTVAEAVSQLCSLQQEI